MKLIKINETVFINPEYIQYIEVVLPDKNSLEEALEKFGIDYLVEFGVPLFSEFVKTDFLPCYTLTDQYKNHYALTKRKIIGNERLEDIDKDLYCKLVKDDTGCYFLPDELKCRCLFIRVKLQDKDLNISFKDASNFLKALEQEGIVECSHLDNSKHNTEEDDDFDVEGFLEWTRKFLY